MVYRHSSKETIRTERVPDARSPVLGDRLEFHFGVTIAQHVRGTPGVWGGVGCVKRPSPGHSAGSAQTNWVPYFAT